MSARDVCHTAQAGNNNNNNNVSRRAPKAGHAHTAKILQNLMPCSYKKIIAGAGMTMLRLRISSPGNAHNYERWSKKVPLRSVAERVPVILTFPLDQNRRPGLKDVTPTTNTQAQNKRPWTMLSRRISFPPTCSNLTEQKIAPAAQFITDKVQFVSKVPLSRQGSRGLLLPKSVTANSVDVGSLAFKDSYQEVMASRVSAGGEGSKLGADGNVGLASKCTTVRCDVNVNVAIGPQLSIFEACKVVTITPS